MEENLNSSESVSEVVDTQTEQTVETNNAEVVETQTEKPVQTPEENSKFAEMRRARETAEAKAQQIERNYSIAKKYATYGVFSEADIKEKYSSQGITTLEQFESALREQEMKDKGLDPDTYKKYVEEDPAVREAREWKESQSQIEKDRVQAQEFLNYFEEKNKRPWNPKSDILPPKVIEYKDKGKSLADAYAYYYSEQLETENAELKGKKQAEELNQKNAETSTGSMTGNGPADSGFFTADQVRNMTPAQVKTHLKAIEESMKKW